MAASYSKVPLSGGTTGRGIKVVATSTPGTTVHTAGTGTTNMDEVWLYLQNNHTADVVCTVEFGGVTAVSDQVILTVPTKAGAFLVVPGWLLQNALVVSVFAATGNVIMANGYVNRITP